MITELRTVVKLMVVLRSLLISHRTFVLRSPSISHAMDPLATLLGYLS